MMTVVGERARRRVDWPIADQAVRVRMNQAEDDLDTQDAHIDRLLAALEEQRRTTNRLLWAVVSLSFSLISVAITIAVAGG